MYQFDTPFSYTGLLANRNHKLTSWKNETNVSFYRHSQCGIYIFSVLEDSNK
ncbi:hypothetical protein GCWU000325_00189 [Alloprevotella tannerae ATCC 51259]|uniref:Uncharacterized protein n=1 Tax=Alloprevotella tannerae ATCC 51259 TaxID=626522 RepID=C9LDC0_9BACT|nr:hypothetical protein GCWU000325_00189 [Alloprevotella tannerae ATCC 51259]